VAAGRASYISAAQGAASRLGEKRIFG